VPEVCASLLSSFPSDFSYATEIQTNNNNNGKLTHLTHAGPKHLHMRAGGKIYIYSLK